MKRHLGREPNLTELGVFSVMWSEHCSYKSSRVHLQTFPTTGPRVIQGPGENAGVVDIGDGLAAAFKMECHNHPSYIEPYQGAATGVGGILRDVFTMGARPIASANSLRFGDPSHPRTAYLLEGVVAGIGGYGNCIGVPTVGGEVMFHPSYNGNCLVNAFTLGILPADKIFLGTAAGRRQPGHVHRREDRPRRNPRRDDGLRRVRRLHRGEAPDGAGRRPVHGEAPARGLPRALQDRRGRRHPGHGRRRASPRRRSRWPAAPGTASTSSSTRCRARGGHDAVRDPPLESQERMLLVAAEGKEDVVRKICTKWDLDAAIVGRVTDTGRWRAHWQGQARRGSPGGSAHRGRAEVPASDEAAPGASPSCTRSISRRSPSRTISATRCSGCSPARPSRRRSGCTSSTTTWSGSSAPFDRAATRRWCASPQATRATRRRRSRSRSARTGATASSIRTSARSHAVAECARNIACVGGEPIAVTDCLNFGNPEKPEIMWQFAGCVRGIGDACRALGTPVVSGNVSLYNETEGQGILPTPTIGMVGLVPDVEKTCTSAFKHAGDVIALVGTIQGEVAGRVPRRRARQRGRPPAGARPREGEGRAGDGAPRRP